MNEELLAKLTTALSGDIDTYNEVINTFQETKQKIDSVEADLTETAQKLQDSEARGQTYLAQISNLLSKIPVGNTQQNATAEQQLEDIKNSKW